MGVAPRDMPVTRDMVAKWLKNWRRYSKRDEYDKTFEEYLYEQIGKLELQDEYVNVAVQDSWDVDEVHIVDMILADLGSYA
jgi:hypothetical protein